VNPYVWESVVAVWDMKGKDVTNIQLHPIELGFGLPRYERGWPTLTDNQKILEHLQELSKPYGTDMKINNGIGIIQL
jgi:poly-gamma-glutamate synthesis protein (capsule biosynthesis protein)